MERQDHPTVLIELEDHCIETTARRVRRRMVSAYLQGTAEGPAVEAEIELMNELLETTDFALVRHLDEELAGGHRVDVVVYRDAEGTAQLKKVPTGTEPSA